MPEKTKAQAEKDVTAELVTALHKLVDVQAELLQQQKERDELIYKFLFIGDPDKKIPPFVSEVRIALGEHADWIASYKSVLSRILWLIVGVVITTVVGAFLIWRFPVVVSLP